jgi:hypothetical protein
VGSRPYAGDPREIIVDEENKDIRVCDVHTTVKIVFEEKNQIKGVLVGYHYVYQG